ncbi:hypothetical protein M9H77_30604 [Catharanthus roseus]|uniref:Uncharacterized protein n=1 Tax=Catharanthus roseus TaxID=4058 RepID=A0ACC0A0C4_CATRO|nr:hypothetical protein M9H77_30604 [Catharanthus roseus]
MRQVEVIVSSVYIVFDEHTRRFAEESHLPYTLMPLMMDIVRAAMAAIPSTSSSTEAAAGTSDAARVSFSTPPPLSINAPGTSTVDPSPGPLVTLGIPRIFDTYTVYG